MALTPAQKAHLEHTSKFIEGDAAHPTLGVGDNHKLVHPDTTARTTDTRAKFNHDGTKLTADGESFSVNNRLNKYKQHNESLDYARRAGHDESVISGHTDNLSAVRQSLTESSQEFAANAGDALHAHHEAHGALVAERDLHLKEIQAAKDKAIAAAKVTHKGNEAAMEAAVKDIGKRHEQAVEGINNTYKPHIDHHAGQIEAIGHDVRDLEAATGKNLSASLGKGGQALEKAEATLGKKFGTNGVATAVATEKTAADSGKLLGSKMLGGVKTGIVANWKSPGFMGKAKVVAGGLMMADGARRAISDIGGMMGGEKGLDKDGKPLPQPGIMNVGFDVLEAGLGAVVASSKFLTKGR